MRRGGREERKRGRREGGEVGRERGREKGEEGGRGRGRGTERRGECRYLFLVCSFSSPLHMGFHKAKGLNIGKIIFY